MRLLLAVVVKLVERLGDFEHLERFFLLAHLIEELRAQLLVGLARLQYLQELCVLVLLHVPRPKHDDEESQVEEDRVENKPEVVRVEVIHESTQCCVERTRCMDEYYDVRKPKLTAESLEGDVHDKDEQAAALVVAAIALV